MTQQMMMKKVLMILAVAALLLGAVLAQAQTYDFVSQFTISSNPNGVWSYGWEPSRGGSFNLMNVAWTDTTWGTQEGWAGLYGAANPPTVAIAVTDINHPTVVVPAGTINVHPGPGGENAAVRWTTPASGTYTIEGNFIGNDFAFPTTTDVAILRGPLEVFSGFVESYNVPLPFSATIPLLAGETIDFTVGFGRNGNYFGDSTGLAATITKISNIACTLPPVGMVGWWPGDGTTNDIVNGNDGTMTGGAAFAPGLVGQAFRFSADNDRVALGNPAELQLSGKDFTVDAWVNYDPADLNTDGAIVSKMGDYQAANGDGWMLLRQIDNHFWFCFGAAPNNGCTPTADTTVISTTTATAGAWYHVAGVKTGTEFAIYVNGVKEASKPLSAFVDTDQNPAFIGDFRLRHQLLGLIDEVEIFNRALTAEEIRAIYLAGAAGKCKPQVPVDIRPGGCPNPLSTRELGVLPVAIAGTATLDVTQIDPASVRLEGVAPLRFSLADVATPYEPYTGKVNALDCTAAGPDGIVDLTLSFDAPAIIAALGPVVDGQVRVLKLTGNLLPAFGGRPIVGEDVIVIQVPRGQPR